MIRKDLSDTVALGRKAQTLRDQSIRQDLPIRQVLFSFIETVQSWLRMILPELVLGSASMNSTIRGYL